MRIIVEVEECKDVITFRIEGGENPDRGFRF